MARVLIVEDELDIAENIAALLAAHGEARATEIAKRLGVAHPTALKGLARGRLPYDDIIILPRSLAELRD